MHFTDLSVRALKPAPSKYHWDDSTPGFGLWVGKRRKTWVVMRGADRKRVTVGRYPDLPLSTARVEAKRLLLQAPEPKELKILFREARAVFLAENYRDASGRTLSEASRHLNKHFKKLEAFGLSEIGDQDIKKSLDKLSDTPSEQLHAYRFLRTFFRWCTRAPRRFIKHSPMDGYEPPGKDKKGTRILTDKELVAVWKAADSPPYCVVRLLILWGTRSGETRALRRLWASAGYPSNQDWAMTIPGAFTKNGRDHAIPILPMAQAVLDGCPAGPYYFPSRWGDSHLSDGAWSKIKREVQKKSGTKNWQLRDLRRTFRSTMARLKVPRDLCEVLINHAPPVLDEIYDRYDRQEEKREALQRYETWLHALLKA
jgi:integrase